MRINEDYANNYAGGLTEENNRIQGDRPESPETCTTDTDKVDTEIRNLRREKEQLMQQIRKAAGDEKKEAALKEKIARIDIELRLKDNDTYRRQNAERY